MANLGSLNIADYSTDGATLELTTVCASHERIVDNGAAPRWEIQIAAFPVTHRKRLRNTVRNTWPLTFTFSERADPALLPGQAQRLRVAGFGGAQSGFFARDVVAGLRHDALSLRHLDLEYHHVTLTKCHFR